MILNVEKMLWERRKRSEALRRQMRMTKKCSKELDLLLGLIGIDYSRLEPGPVPVENENEKQIEERWR